MNKIRYYILVTIGLLLSSLIMFFIHFEYFGQLENTIYYSLMNLCFIPINIIVVTIVFEKLFERRKKADKLSKINMLVGVFFSDMGFKLMKILVNSDKDIKDIIKDVRDLNSVKSTLKNYRHKLDFSLINFEELKKLIVENQIILTNLISNENILEHELFADLLMATLHLRDEILFREGKNLGKDDCDHLKVDIERVYKNLTIQWVDYLIHLKKEYPYLYKTAVNFNYIITT